MTVFKEKLAGVDQALSELGTSDEEMSDVRSRFADAKPVDLQAVDGELQALAEGVALEIRTVASDGARKRTPEAPAQDWDETTDVESMDDSDFVLLVDEDDLEELEKVGEEDAVRTSPPAVPRESEGDEGFFKKLFGGRRTSNRP